ncbi:hypothetical protein GGR52DRAFT_442006 [Hypoxylon sp. FL1284]|nr:hypothetical protein GGR52DRAFT_442006 [Hypoxylon sp. FL1284]
MRGFFMSDEELGKKDDDHKLSKNGGGLRQPNWHPARVPPRRSLRRIGVVLLVAVVVYIFFKNIPVLGPDPRMRRPIYPDTKLPELPTTNDGQNRNPSALSRLMPRPAAPPERIYNGPVRFLELAKSLHAISATRGGTMINRNVLFAASSLKSAATLLPIACQMGTELKNYVHFTLMGRSDIDIQELRKLNGIDDSCQIIFHDARPDYGQSSTDDRMETAVFRAMHHTFIYMHPQAILVDGSNDEDSFLIRGVQQHSRAKKSTLIELPRRAAKKLMWLTKLDSQALRMWNQNHIDILIQAVPGASGSLIRLLRSLNAADYTSSSVPHLTIELPHDIDSPTKRFLETFTWPPAHVPNPTNARFLSLRHRIPRQRMNEEESSARLLESFWPAQPTSSHILVLSPQAELSPDFFHYLRYSLLEYRYSSTAMYQHWDRRLFGISLEQPHQLLNGKDALFLPTLPPLRTKSDSDRAEDEAESAPFLWQAPTSNAMLFMGEKWMELHDFVSRSLEAKQKLDPVPELLNEKLVSTQHPSWLEHALRLARIRGYWTLYPGQDIATNLATVHSELHQVPEEYADQEHSKPLLSDDASEEEIENVRQKIRDGVEIPLAPVSLLDSLPNDGYLRAFTDLPIVSWTGEVINVAALSSSAAQYATEFKGKIGKCDDASNEQKARETTSAQDLFCGAD